jgi:hypothetical protein
MDCLLVVGKPAFDLLQLLLRVPDAGEQGPRSLAGFEKRRQFRISF